ncbi:MAG: glycosyltransferase [Acholeplasmataceae bacterium]
MGDGFDVTLCVLTYNRLRYTQVTLDTLRRNSEYPFQLHVLDNGSTDGTVEYLTRLRDQGLIQRLTLLDRNEGLSAGKNRLVREADTSFVGVLDNDFYFHPGWLRKLMTVMQATPQITVASPFNAVIKNRASHVRGRELVAGHRVVTLDKVGGTFLIRRADYLAAGGMPSLPGLVGYASGKFFKHLRRTVPGARLVTLQEPLGDHMPDLESFRSLLGVDDEYYNWVEACKRDITALDFEQWRRWRVDIVVPVYGALPLLRRCLKNLRAVTVHPYRLILVNDRVEDEAEVRELATAYGACFIAHATNKGFPRSCNDGWRAGRGTLVCFLNSDTVPTRYWLARMVRHLARDRRCAIAGPSTSSCASPQRLPQLFAKRRKMTDSDIAAVGVTLGTQFRNVVVDSRLSGFCFLTWRDLLKRLDGFDEDYGVGYGEEEDFEVRARALGYHCGWVRDSYVHHFGKESFKQLDQAKLASHRRRNAARFTARRARFVAAKRGRKKVEPFKGPGET